MKSGETASSSSSRAPSKEGPSLDGKRTDAVLHVALTFWFVVLLVWNVVATSRLFWSCSWILFGKM